MVRDTIELILRVRAIVAADGDFFDAIKQWYEDIKLSQKVIRLMLARTRAGARVLLTVNGHLLAGDAVTVTPQAQHITWLIAQGLLLTGDNTITVSLDPASPAALYLQTVTALQEQGLPRQTVDLSVAEPAPTPFLRLREFGEAHHAGNCCCITKGGYLTLWLHLPQRAAVTLSLGLAQDDAAGADDWPDVLKEVVQRVRDKLREREEEGRRAERFDRGLAARLRDEAADLDAYLELMRLQVEPALRGTLETTLEQVMARTGDPDRLIRARQAAARAEEVQPAEPMQVMPASPAQVVPAEPPVVYRAGPAAPVRPRVPSGARYRPAARPASSGGCLKSCLILLVVSVLLIAGGVAGLWFFVIKPLITLEPKITIDSPTEGQTLAPGMSLQVWVSAQDSAEVRSISLTVDSDANSPVLEPPTPDKIIFPSGTTETGTKVFPLRLRPGALPEAKTVTLTATMVSGNGKTLTTRRTFKVGGKDPGLGLSIQPPEPKAGERVTVTIHGVNLAPGARVSYTVHGTDSYQDAATLDMQPDGTASFTIPGALPGIRDDIEVKLEGSSLAQKVSYSFR